MEKLPLHGQNANDFLNLFKVEAENPKLLDDWRGQTQLALHSSELYKLLKEKCNTDPAGYHVLALIDEATYYAYQRTKIIIQHMGEYTLHDGDHLFRVLKLMEKLLPTKTMSALSVPELMLMILTAFFHDIGMAASKKDVTIWETLWDEDITKDSSSDQYIEFKKYCQGFPSILSTIQDFELKGQSTKADLLKRHLIAEYIRSTHAERARSIIDDDWNGKIKYRDIDLTNEFAQLCFSHNEDASTLLEFDTSFLCGPGIYTCLPFVGVILRLADILDFDAKRTPSVLFSHLFVRNPISISEWQKHRSIDAWDINNTNIRFQARCEHPAIESSIRQFCDQIDIELATANTILTRLNDSVRNPFPDHYKVSLPLKIDRSKIGPIKRLPTGKPAYNYQETKFTLNKAQVIDLLMGTKLYGNPEIALRELLQNSIDACLLRQAMAKSWNNPYEPKISIRFYSETDDFLEISDNGTGMDLDIINKFYSSVGTSYYKSSEFYDLKAKVELDYTPISRFGIGVLSCFMVSDYLKVNTKRLKGPYESSEAYEIIVEGQDSIFWVREGSMAEPGTSTHLALRTDHPWRLITHQDLIDSICKIIPRPPFPIEIITPTLRIEHSGEKFRTSSFDDLRDYYWRENPNIKELAFTLSSQEYGIFGKALVGILEDRGLPVPEIELQAKQVNVDGNNYTLERSIKYGTNEIEKKSKTIEINEEGTPNLSNSTTKLATSKAILALHGIEIPFNIFPDYWSSKKQQVQLKWPIPIRLIIDISGTKDLNLNSARTEILHDEKWINFEENLAYLICSQLAKSLSPEYWHRLMEIILSNNKSHQFEAGIKRI